MYSVDYWSTFVYVATVVHSKNRVQISIGWRIRPERTAARYRSPGLPRTSRHDRWTTVVVFEFPSSPIHRHVQDRTRRVLHRIVCIATSGRRYQVVRSDQWWSYCGNTDRFPVHPIHSCDHRRHCHLDHDLYYYYYYYQFVTMADDVWNGSVGGSYSSSKRRL